MTEWRGASKTSEFGWGVGIAPLL